MAARGERSGIAAASQQHRSSRGGWRAAAEASVVAANRSGDVVFCKQPVDRLTEVTWRVQKLGCPRLNPRRSKKNTRIASKLLRSTPRVVSPARVSCRPSPCHKSLPPTLPRVHTSHLVRIFSAAVIDAIPAPSCARAAKCGGRAEWAQAARAQPRMRTHV